MKFLMIVLVEMHPLPCVLLGYACSGPGCCCGGRGAGCTWPSAGGHEQQHQKQAGGGIHWGWQLPGEGASGKELRELWRIN